MSRVECKGCGRDLTRLEALPWRVPCLWCGSMGRLFSVQVSGEITPKGELTTQYIRFVGAPSGERAGQLTVIVSPPPAPAAGTGPDGWKLIERIAGIGGVYALAKDLPGFLADQALPHADAALGVVTLVFSALVHHIERLLRCCSPWLR